MNAEETENLQAVVHFVPQVWQNDRAVSGDPIEYRVPLEDATDDEGEILPDNTGKSDRLKDHENAPERVSKHQGPFYVTIHAVEEVEE